MFKLANGFKVINLENQNSKVVSLQVWINCGSIYEEDSQKGLSHFIEHLVFKGSNGYGLGEIAKKIESMGGELNAFTSFENTCYYVNIPSVYLNEALKVLNQLAFCPCFDEQEIDNERGVVLEEINRGADLPTRVLSENFFNIHFPEHNYGDPILGTKDIINNVSRDQIIDYYKKYYSPKNSFLVISGNIGDEKTLQNTIQNIFTFENNNNFEAKIISEAKFTNGINVKLNKKNINEAYFLCGYHIPNFFNDDIPAIDVLSTILSDGESSILYQKIRNNNLVNSIFASSYTPKHGGIFSLSFTLNPDKDFNNKLASIFKSLHEIFQNVIVNGFSEEDIEKAITLLVSEKVYEMETPEGLARRMGYIYSVSKNLDYDNVYYEKLKKITNKEIIEVVKKYILKENINISCVLPNSSSLSEKDLKQIYIDNFKSLNADSSDAVISKTVNSKIDISSIFNINSKSKKPEIIQLDSGLKLILAQNSVSPLFSMKIGINGGTRFETDKTQGINSLCSRLMLYGAGDLKYTDIVKRIDSTASSMNAFSGRNSFGFSLECISSFNKEMLDLLSLIILQPNFEDQYFEIEKNVVIQEIKSIEDNLATYAGLLLLESIYKNHPYRYNVSGSIESVSSFNREKVLDFYNKIISSKEMVISAVGSFDKKMILSFAENLSSNLNKNSDYFGKIISKEAKQNEKRFLKKIKESKQSHIALAYKTCDILSEDVTALKLVYSILAGQSGRLFMNLRDKKSLAYTVSPIMMFGVDAGYFGTYIACEHEKEALATASMKNELKILKTNKINDEELKRAKSFLIGRHVLGMQRYADLAFSYAFDELFGLGYDSYKEYENKINKVSNEDIIKTVNKYFNDDKENLVLLSDKSIPFGT